MDTKSKNYLLERLRLNAVAIVYIFVLTLGSLLYFLSPKGIRFLVESNENVQTARLFLVGVLVVLLIVYAILYFTRKFLRNKWQN